MSLDDEQTTEQDRDLNESLDEAILFAKKYLEDLLSFFGLNTDVYATSEDNEVIELNVPNTHLNGFLIGQHGDTMRSLQYMSSMALKNANFANTRVNVDIADYKKQRAERLEDHAQVWLEEVKSTAQPKHLPPMNAADRRTVHRVAGEHGLETISEGFGRDRHIVLKPAETVEETKEKPETAGKPANKKPKNEKEPASTQPEEVEDTAL